jgi:hypothetical protein
MEHDVSHQHTSASEAAKHQSTVFPHVSPNAGSIHNPAPCIEWNSEDQDALCAESFTHGPSRLVKVFDGSKPAVALLLSHELALWMLNCVVLQRQSGQVKCDAEEEMAILDQEKETLCARVYATAATDDGRAESTHDQAPLSSPQPADVASKMAQDKMRLLQICNGATRG